MESVVFNFDPAGLDAEVKACETNTTMPLIMKYIPKNGTVLEAGCGMGNIVKYLSNQGYHIVGVEIDEGLVAALNKTHPEMEIKAGNVNALPYPNNSFEGMVSLGVLEHTVEGPQTAMKEALRVLKPGGVAVITVPIFNAVRKMKYYTGLGFLEYYLRWIYYKIKGINMDWLYKSSLNAGGKKFLFHRWPSTGNFFEYHFKPEEFERMLKEAGFEIVVAQPHDKWGGLQFDFGIFLINKNNQPSFLGKILSSIFSIFPYGHYHQLFTVVRKPLQ